MNALLFIRHAETGMTGTFCGHANPPINARGHEQIQVLLKGGTFEKNAEAKRIDAIYSSDLERARSTADALAKALRLPSFIAPELREIGFGEWEGLRWEEIEERDPAYARAWTEAYPNLPAPGGESFAAFESRVIAAVDRLLTLPGQGRLAVVTHAGVMRVVLRRLCGLDEQQSRERTKAYCCCFDYPTGEYPTEVSR